MAKKLASLEIRFQEESIKLFPIDGIPNLELDAGKSDLLHRLISTLSCYREHRKMLVDTQYSKLASSLPDYYGERKLLIVLCCADGVIIRHDLRDWDAVVGGCCDRSIKDLAPILSDNFVHIIDDEDDKPSDLPGPSMTLQKVSQGGDAEDIMMIQTNVIARTSGADTIQRPGRPLRIVETDAIFELGLVGEELGVNAKEGSGQQFVTRTPIKLKVGWDKFEVYPPIHEAEWSEDAARVWAESDILYVSARCNARRERFAALDPRYGARQHFTEILAEFDKVLEAAAREEDLQKFLTEHPSFIDPTFATVWPKFALGAKVTDFVFRHATGEYLLVELEHSTKKLFTKPGIPSAKLTQAIDQILDWHRYLEDNLSYVQSELGLDGISSNPKSLIVIGRSSTLSSDNRRKLVTLAGQFPNLRILTYDDLRLQTLKVLEHLVGPCRPQSGATEIYYPPGRFELP